MDRLTWLKIVRLGISAVEILPEKDRLIWRGPNRLELQKVKRAIEKAVEKNSR